jgi:hypothetical protein
MEQKRSFGYLIFLKISGGLQTWSPDGWGIPDDDGGGGGDDDR